jgi:hypothetical protein
VRSTRSVDRAREDELNAMLPLLLQESFGAQCDGCLVIEVDDGKADLVCVECGAAISGDYIERVAYPRSH